MPQSDSTSDISLNFVGPFTFTEGAASVFEVPCSRAAGIYLWTIRQRRDNTHLIHYVGETKDLAKRHREHLIRILGLDYGIFDPEKAQDGESELRWKGLWRDKSSGGPLQQLAAYRKHHSDVLEYVSIINIFFAELQAERGLRKHIEGCIAKNLRKKHPEQSRLYPSDNRVGTLKSDHRCKLSVTASEIIRGLDSEITF
ncbi:MAG: GIY-YIG nuclease family protein [Planctomycetota bacterium]|jgi:hypothetical protein